MDLRALLIGLCFAALWSSAFTSARIIVADAPPLAALALRFTLSGLIGVGLAFLLGQSARLTRAQWRSVLIFGICQNALYLGLNFVAMQTVQASLAAIIASTMPLLVALLGWLLFSERVPALGLAGLVAGLAGTAIIMASRVSGGADPFGLALCAAGVLALTFATLAVRGATSGGNILMVVGLQMLIGAAALWPVALATETLVVRPSWSLAAAFAYTTIFPGLVATWIWFMLVRRIGAVRAATFHFLNPFFGVAIAAAFLGEAIGPLDLLGVAVVAGGILAVQISRQMVRPAATPSRA